MITIILFFSAWSVFLKDNWSTSTFVTNYLPLWLFPILWISYKYIKKTHFVRASEMDFVSGLEAIEAECHDEAPPSTILGKFWALLM